MQVVCFYATPRSLGALTCGCVQILTFHRCSQYLGVNQSIFEKQYCTSRYFVHSQYSGFMYCRYCEYLQYLEVLYYVDISGLAVFPSSLLWILAVFREHVLRVTRGPVLLRILPGLQVFRGSILNTLYVLSGFCAAHTLSTLSIRAFLKLLVFKPSQYSQYLGPLSTRHIWALYCE